MRTKNYFPESEIAHMWANQTRTQAYKAGANHNQFYFEGKTIYSYGRHFPIAVLHGENDRYCLFTTRTYSNTTAGHIQTVRGGASHKTIIYCEHPDSAAAGNHSVNIRNFEGEAKASADKLARARKPEKYLSEIAVQRARFEKYCSYFKLNIAKITKQYKLTWLFVADQKQYQEIQEKVRARILAEAKKRDKENAVTIKKWRAFEKGFTTCTHYGTDAYGNTVLRSNAETIETSKGISFSVAVGKRFFGTLNAIKKAGGCEGNCGDKKILDYKITSVNGSHVVIGCHDITWNEIDSIAKQLNWK